MRNRVPQPDLGRGKKETVGQKTCGANQCPNIMPLPHNESRTVHNRHLLLTHQDQNKLKWVYGDYSDIGNF